RGPRLRRARRDQPGRRMPAHLGLRPRQRARRLARLRLPDAGGGRADEPDRRARCPAGAGRRFAGRYLDRAHRHRRPARRRDAGPPDRTRLRRRYLPVRRRHAPALLCGGVVPQRRRGAAAAVAQRASFAGAGPDLAHRRRLDVRDVHDGEVLAHLLRRDRTAGATRRSAVRDRGPASRVPRHADRAARGGAGQGSDRALARLADRQGAGRARVRRGAGARCAVHPGDRHGAHDRASRAAGPAHAGQSPEDRRRAARAAPLRIARGGQRIAAATGARDGMKLTGVKVVDLSWFLPGPWLTLALADHGAEGIKVEARGGDPGRHIGPSEDRTSVFFRNWNRGKKSVVIDLKSAAGRESLLRLCDGADVLVESFRPGVAARLGIGYDAVSARNPGIVYCSISAFGQDGPYVARPAHGLRLEAIAGVLSVTLGDDGRPAVPGIPIADAGSALHGLSGVLMALLRRVETGRGDHLDIAMHDSLFAACANALGAALIEGRQPVVKHQRTTGGAAFYRIYETRDGRQLVLAGQEGK